MRILRSFWKNQKNQVLDAISKGDEEWLWNNYSRITSEWLAGHAQLEAKQRQAAEP